MKTEIQNVIEQLNRLEQLEKAAENIATLPYYEKLGRKLEKEADIAKAQIDIKNQIEVLHQALDGMKKAATLLQEELVERYQYIGRTTNAA